MLDNMVMTPLGVISKAAELASAVKSDSLIEYGKVTRVEPVTLVDHQLLSQPVLTDVLQSLNSIFAAYYLQAVSLSCKVGSVDIIKLLDPLNPNRDVLANSSTAITGGLESFAHALPVPYVTFGLEAYGDNPNASTTEVKVMDSLDRATNLSVGKLLDVKIESNGHKISIPVAVRLIVSTIASDVLVHTLSLKSKDTSVKERYHAWRAGMLTTIKDMVLCWDLISEHRRALMKDKTGFYAENEARNNRNILSTLLSGKPSIATASNIVVMSERSAKQLEAAANGKLKDFNTREKIFKDSYVMLLAVVDTQWEQVTIYHRSIDNATQLSYRDLKGASKDTGMDIGKILASFLEGKGPNL